MKTYLVLPLVGIVLAGLLTTGGCVSKAEYDKLMAMNRNATDEKNRAIAAAQELRAENQRLTEELDAVKKALAAKQGEIDLLQAAKNDLQKAFDELMAKYNELSGKGPIILEGAPVLPPELDKLLKQLAEENPDLLEYLPKYGMVKLKADLTFSPGSDVVTPAAKAALAKFVQIVNSATGQRYNIYIAGHTDDMPIVKPDTKRTHPDNWYLSVHRSVAVLKDLASAGLAQKRMGAMGFGEFHPVAPNAANHKGNVANRRVEIWIVPPDRFLTLPSVGSSDVAAPKATKAAKPAEAAPAEASEAKD
jgi:chemotaxis protein MotB